MSELEQQKRKCLFNQANKNKQPDNISYPTYHYMKEHSSYVYVEKNIQKRLDHYFSCTRSSTRI